jgi:arylsulfatase A-like enzyme
VDRARRGGPGRNLVNTLGPDDIRYLEDLYDAEVAHLDEAVGEFLATIEQAGLLENTVVVVTSDHGEEFADHGHYNHGFSLYQEQLRVPLIIRYEPAFAPGAVVEHPVQGIDLAPTLVELAGLEVPAAWQGVPLTVEPPDRPRPVFVPFLTRQDGSRCGVLRVGKLKYIDYPTGARPSDPNADHLLFDLSTDPSESEDRLGADAARWRAALAELWDVHAQVAEAETSVVSSELERELEALGYGGGD